MILEILSIIGILLSVYAFYVERKALKLTGYKAVCDINDTMSCSKAFSSKYGHTLGISNSVYGFFFYIVVLLLAVYSQMNYIFYLSILSLIFSAYLAYNLYFKLKDFCLVCTGIYIVNILILIFSIW